MIIVNREYSGILITTYTVSTKSRENFGFDIDSVYMALFAFGNQGDKQKVIIPKLFHNKIKARLLNSSQPNTGWI